MSIAMSANPNSTARFSPFWQKWPPEKQAEFIAYLKQKLGKSAWIPHTPTPKQKQFLELTCREAFYGGSAGGGKSDALLMAALQYVDVPGYAAILFRRTFADLALPGALMDRCEGWLAGSDAHWNDTEHTWTFPSGATLTFGYLETERHKHRYQSAEFQMVGFDELTQFSESQYLYLFSRLRRLQGVEIPLRMRAASNPGGMGHDWVKTRFIDDPCRVFVPARLEDNPYLDQAAYRESLMELDPVTREQLLAGNWMVRPEGTLFKRHWFEIVDVLPAALERVVRYWDKAGTEGGGDYSAGVLMGRHQRTFYVMDVVRGQWSAYQRRQVMRQTTQMDAGKYYNYSVWQEQEGGSGGKESAENTIADLAGYDVHAEPVRGSKVVRANPLASQAEAGNVKILRGAWNHEYLEELCAFPNEGVHDDMVDASSGAFAKMNQAEYRVGSTRYA